MAVIGALPTVTGSEAKDGYPPPQATVGNGGSSHKRAAATRHWHESTLTSSFAGILVRATRSHRRTIRRRSEWCEAASEHLLAILSQSVIADSRWQSKAVGDGLALLLQNIVDLLVPELQRPGRLRTAYTGRTLRENLAGKAAREDRAPGPV